VHVPWPAVVRDADGAVVAGEVIDVSLSGMKLRAGNELVVGGDVTIHVTLPRGAGEIEVPAHVIRRDSEGIAVAFGGLPAAQADRFKPFLPTWDLRRRAERASVELPIQVDGHDFATKGHTVDLSVGGGRVATEEALVPGSLVAVSLTPRDGSGLMRIRAVVWEVEARGAVLVFANLSTADFVRLRSYIDSLLVPRP
jgi:PilZ domain-containing protein